MGFRNQLEDLKYLTSKENKTSRGFYIFFTIAAVLLIIATIAMEVAAFLGFSTGIWRTVSFAGFPTVLVILFICVKLLSK